MISNCIICNSNYKESRIRGLLECESCHFITTDIDLSQEEIEGIYSADYFKGKEYSNYLLDKNIIQKNFKKRLKKLLSFVDNSREKSLFEIGCAYGFFLELARDNFREVAGIDISPEATGYAQDFLKLNVATGDFLGYDLRMKFDVFCLWDTIEHLKEPHLYIKKISEHINKDGVIAITTADIGSLNARIRGSKWRQIHPPTHIHYFSKETLSRLLKRNEFDIIYVGRPGFRISLDNIFYSILVLGRKNYKLYDFFRKLNFFQWWLYINMFDLLYVVGRKR